MQAGVPAQQGRGRRGERAAAPTAAPRVCALSVRWRPRQSSRRTPARFAPSACGRRDPTEHRTQSMGQWTCAPHARETAQRATSHLQQGHGSCNTSTRCRCSPAGRPSLPAGARPARAAARAPPPLHPSRPCGSRLAPTAGRAWRAPQSPAARWARPGGVGGGWGGLAATWEESGGEAVGYAARVHCTAQATVRPAGGRTQSFVTPCRL